VCDCISVQQGSADVTASDLRTKLVVELSELFFGVMAMLCDLCRSQDCSK
jgi:hypothetical protein